MRIAGILDYGNIELYAMHIYIYFWVWQIFKKQSFDKCLCQVFRWIAESAEDKDIPQDAVHGKQRTPPDVHLYFQWLIDEAGKGYTHFDILLQSNCISPVRLPAETTK